MRRFLSLASLLMLLAACGSARTSRPATVAQPDIRTEPVGTIFFGSGSSAPVTLEVAIRNNATVPIVARSVEVSAPGMQTYTVRSVRRVVRETIAPGDIRTISVFTTAYTSVRNPSEPLTLRTHVLFEANGATWREIVQQ